MKTSNVIIAVLLVLLLMVGVGYAVWNVGHSGTPPNQNSGPGLNIQLNTPPGPPPAPPSNSGNGY